MKVHILGQHNTKSDTINGSNVNSFEGMPEKFLKYYRENPMLKNQPILLTFENFEDKFITENPIYRGEDEGEPAYKLRMLDMVTSRINARKNLIFGFSAVYVLGGDTVADGQKRKMGIIYYEPPFCSAPLGDNGLPRKDYILPFCTILGRIVPPSA